MELKQEKNKQTESRHEKTPLFQPSQPNVRNIHAIAWRTDEEEVHPTWKISRAFISKQKIYIKKQSEQNNKLRNATEWVALFLCRPPFPRSGFSFFF